MVFVTCVIRSNNCVVNSFAILIIYKYTIFTLVTNLFLYIRLLFFTKMCTRILITRVSTALSVMVRYYKFCKQFVVDYPILSLVSSLWWSSQSSQSSLLLSYRSMFLTFFNFICVDLLRRYARVDACLLFFSLSFINLKSHFYIICEISTLHFLVVIRWCALELDMSSVYSKCERI